MILPAHTASADTACEQGIAANVLPREVLHEQLNRYYDEYEGAKATNKEPVSVPDFRTDRASSSSTRDKENAVLVAAAKKEDAGERKRRRHLSGE